MLHCAEPRATRDEAGGARRIVSLVPSVTDILLALGAGGRLVGRTDYDKNPALASLPSVGGTVDPSVERIIALEPDLVISWRSGEAPGVGAQLDRLRIPVRRVGTETLADTREAIRDLGGWLGLQGAAARLLRNMDTTLAAVRAEAANRDTVTALYLVNLDPPMAAGPGTFIHDLMVIAGARNAVADADVYWPTVAIETIAYRNPDVIIWPRVPGGPAWDQVIAARPAWREIRAVRAGRVLPVEAGLFDRPADRLGEAAQALRRSFDSLSR